MPPTSSPCQVDLYAATSKARARSMQQIKADKLARAASYHKALAERTQLPRFLRLLDVQLRAALAHMVAASVADATAALHAAAPPSLLAGGSCDAVAAEDEEGPPSGRSATGGGTAPGTGGILMCSVVFAPDGSVAFSPSEEEWTAAMEAEVVASSLHLAGSMVPLLSLPAFEGYAAAAGLTGEAVPTAAELAQQDSVFTAAAGELRALVAGSFAAARQQAVRYAGRRALLVTSRLCCLEEAAGRLLPPAACPCKPARVGTHKGAPGYLAYVMQSMPTSSALKQTSILRPGPSGSGG